MHEKHHDISCIHTLFLNEYYQFIFLMGVDFSLVYPQESL